MVRKIDFVAKVINIGSSSVGITIPKDIKDLLDIKKGNYVQMSIEKLEKKKLKSSPEENP